MRFQALKMAQNCEFGEFFETVAYASFHLPELYEVLGGHRL